MMWSIPSRIPSRWTWRSRLLGAGPERAVFFGDSVHDMHSGRAAGVKTAAVLWGPFGRADLEPSKPDHWIETPGEILRLLEP